VLTRLRLVLAEELANAQQLRAKTLETMIFRNTESGFKAVPLPREAQAFPVYAIHTADINHDGIMDLVLGVQIKVVVIGMDLQELVIEM
jgi:4'-phosphopantetheinyl transferase EntD